MLSFPEFTGLRCLMMPYVQGDPDSVPSKYWAYRDIIRTLVINAGDIGYLTIDESLAQVGLPHRGARAKHGRALHTEAGRIPGHVYRWGGGGHWGSKPAVTLDRETQILIASNTDGSCAVWDVEHEETTEDGDIGHLAAMYPYESAAMLKAGEVRRIGILTPHESLPVKETIRRQFLRVVGSGVHGREPYFTENPLLSERARKAETKPEGG
jgi:hypothetical protein